MMKDIVKPIAVLAGICLVVTALLAFVNQLTLPVIVEAEEKAAAAAAVKCFPQRRISNG